MVNDIVLGIAQKIRMVYPESRYGLYTENVEQGFKEPCFFVSLINQMQRQQIGNRYRETYSFDIIYFPMEDSNINEECNAVSETLYELLEYITAGMDLVRGINLSSRVEDKALHFLVDYTVFAVREKAVEETMEEVIVYGKTTDG